VESLDRPVFSAVQKLSDESGYAGETDPEALRAWRELQGTRQVRLTGTTVADRHDVFLVLDEFTR